MCQNLPFHVANLLSQAKANLVIVKFLGGVITECKGLIHQLHKNTIKIGKGWKCYYKYNKLQKGDKIIFTFDVVMGKVVGVTKVADELA